MQRLPSLQGLAGRTTDPSGIEDPIMCHVHVSRGVTKLGQDIPSVSLPPEYTCRADAPCAKICYARKGRFNFRHNKDLLQCNLDIWRSSPKMYEWDVEVAAFTSRFFRYHSAGEIPDYPYIGMMERVARVCDQTGFLCFTKKYELVDRYVSENGMFPENLHIVYSVWGDLLKPENPYGFPLAYIRFKDGDTYIPENAVPCSGYCGKCVMSGKSCWDMKRGCGDCVVFNQH